MLNHIDYAVKLIDIDQVAHHLAGAKAVFLLSSVGQELNADYMKGIESPKEWPNITRGTRIKRSL